jgi:SAM-dependent methyltransferase/GNAT superfamily N-acetyltransferase
VPAPEGLHLRRFEPGDDEELLGWFPDAAALRRFSGTSLTWPLTRDQLAALRADPRVHAWTGWTTGPPARRVAHAELVRRDEELGLLARVGVAPDRRGHGLGTELLRQVLREARALGVRRLELNVYADNAPARRLYQAAGFEDRAVAGQDEDLRRMALTLQGPPVDADMAAYYARGDEAERLRAVSPLERARTEVLLARHLPSPPSRVLDVGGGPGAYASWLAGRGHRVELLDPIPLHVEQARAAGVAARLGDARRLPWPDEHADAVLLLGPLYHLLERAERVAALREAGRVLVPGGVVVAAVISRFASALDGLVRDFLADARFEAGVERTLRDGDHRNSDRVPGWFTTAYFHRPEEVRGEVEDAGLRLEALVAVEGPAEHLPDLRERLAEPERRARLLRILERVGAEPSLLGASPHLLAIARSG